MKMLLRILSNRTWTEICFLVMKERSSSLKTLLKKILITQADQDMLQINICIRSYQVKHQQFGLSVTQLKSSLMALVYVQALTLIQAAKSPNESNFASPKMGANKGMKSSCRIIYMYM